jgi:hypothetical protein
LEAVPVPSFETPALAGFAMTESAEASFNLSMMDYVDGVDGAARI